VTLKRASLSDARRIAFVCLYEAWPPVTGAASVTVNCARFSSGEIFLVQLGESTNVCGYTPVRVIGVRGPQGRFSKLPAFPGIAAQIARVCKRLNPDVVVLEGASWAVYLAVLMMALRRLLRASVIVYHAHNVEFLLRRARYGAPLAWLTRPAEAYLFRRADLPLVVSKVDQRHVEALYGVQPSILPNGVDYETFAKVSRELARATARRYAISNFALLFMGAYDYPPNREAIDLLARTVLPRLLRDQPGVQLVVTGGDVPYAAPWLRGLGRVPIEELPAVVAACRIGVAPIHQGSGTRLKVLEYMAAGLPVVASRKAVEGLDLVPGRDFLLAESAGETVEAVRRVLGDPGLAQRLATAGQVFVERSYSWPALVRRFEREVDGLLRASQAVRSGKPRR